MYSTESSNKKDFYEILNVSRTSHIDDIKSSYKKLAMKWHPDKNIGCADAEKKFKEISEAYQVLSDESKRRTYDFTGSSDGMLGSDDPFRMFNEIFKNHINQFMGMKNNYSDILNNLSQTDVRDIPFGGVKFSVHTFSPDDSTPNNSGYNIPVGNGNSIDPMELLNQIKMKSKEFATHQPPSRKNKKIKKIKKITKIINEKPDDIIYNVNVSLDDIYNNVKKNFTITRLRKNKKNKYVEKKKKLILPLIGRDVIFHNEGHQMKDYSRNGDLVVIINDNIHEKYRRINEYDLLTTVDININQIYDGIQYKLKLLDGSEKYIQSMICSLLEQDHMYQRIKDYGLPHYNDNNKLVSGDLYIYYNLKLPRDKNDLLKKDSVVPINTTPDDLRVDNDWLTAYNCNLSDIFNSLKM